MVVPAILSYPPPRVSDFHMGEAIGNESPKPLYGAKIPR